MRWPARNPYRWKPWFAWLPVKVEDQTVWLETIERRFVGDCYEARIPDQRFDGMA